MKKWLAIILLLLLTLAGCGRNVPEDSVSEAVPQMEQNTAAEQRAPAEWVENELNFDDVGYVTAAAENFDEYDSVSSRNGVLIGRKQEGDFLTVAELSTVGTVVKSASIPVEDGKNWSITDFTFSEDSLWAIKIVYTEADQETGEIESRRYLMRWELGGEVLLEVPMDETFPWAEGTFEEQFPQIQTVDAQGRILMTTDTWLYALETDGTVAATLDYMGLYYQCCRDSRGNIYLLDTLDTEQAYLLDTETFTLGDGMFPVEMGQTVVPGGGAYELYIIESGALIGVDMDNGSMTTLVKWANMGLVDAVSGVFYLDEQTFLLDTYDVMIGASTMLTLQQLPVTEIPQKEVIRVAYIYASEYYDRSMAPMLTEGTNTQHAMNKFNRESGEYQVEFAYYASATDLQLALMTGDSPDLILFDYFESMDDPSEQLFSKKGYLVDLEELIEADPELSMEDFLPNVITAMKESNGGLYTMPQSFYFRTLTASREYVGDMTSWTVGDIYRIARTLPEDMAVYTTKEGLLEDFLWHSINSYVDLDNLTCDFTNQNFYDLLALAQEHALPSGDSYMECMITNIASMGAASNLASDLKNMDEGIAILGYPGSPGNGGDLVMRDCMGLFTTAPNPEGAWEFLRTLYCYEIQDFVSGLMLSVRQDLFYSDNRRFMENHNVTEEEVEAAEALILGACSRTVYDSPVISIVMEEAEAYFSGDKTAEQVAEIIENRVKIYLSEQF